MKTSDFLQLFLSTAPYILPNLIVVLIGLIIGISRYRRFPKVSRICVIAFSALLLVNVIGLFIPLLHFRVREVSGSVQTAAWVGFAVSTVVSLISASSFGLLIYAIWTERDRS